jgi:hypothetical protein
MIKRKIISFDCDGVLTSGGFVPPEERTNAKYAKINPQEDAIPSLHWLSTLYDIYIISQRSHENSNLGLRAWLHWVLGLELDTIAGVITGPSGGASEGIYMDKGRIVEALGCVAHFDDNPHHLANLSVGVLFPSDMPDSQAAINVYPTVFGWAGCREFLTTPGMTLYGADGRKIVSPADVAIPDPAKEAPMVH